jgi:hypothetical protein
MGKYFGGLTSSDVCKCEIEEARKILRSYRVRGEHTEIIIDMIKEAYYQLHQSMASARALERMYNEVTGQDECIEKNPAVFMTYLTYVEEERDRFPFTVTEED